MKSAFGASVSRRSFLATAGMAATVPVLTETHFAWAAKSAKKEAAWGQPSMDTLPMTAELEHSLRNPSPVHLS